MKGMKTVAGKSRISTWSVIRIVMIPCLLLGTITRKTVFHWIALAALLIWAVIELGRLLAHAAKKKPKRKAVKKAGRKRIKARDRDDGRSLLLQVNYRITEQLSTTYPNVSWLWLERPGTEDIKLGGTWRISLQNADPFNFAEVSLSSSGAMVISLMQVIRLGETTTAVPEQDENDLREGDILDRFDLRKWYAETGEKALCTMVEELNTQGYKRLVISENGNVLIGRPGGEILFSAIADFPPKSAWEDLCTLVREDDIQASVSGSQLAVAW
jgi:hypothetical protein